MNEFAQRYEALVSGLPFTTADGIRCRIIPGAKAPGDLILEVESAGAWRRLKFGSVGLMVEFLYRNEDHLYPPEGGNQGGKKVFRFLHEAIKVGHDQAARNLDWEKRNRQRQGGLFEDGAA